MRGVSVIQGKEFDAPKEGATTPPIFLEDPATLQETGQQRNLVEHLQDKPWPKVCEKAKKASETLGGSSKRWFHWAEIFDPSERNIKELPALSNTIAAITKARSSRNDPYCSSGLAYTDKP